jgi:hypothetical protein
MMRKEGTHKGIGEDMLNVQKNNDSIRWNSKLTGCKGCYLPFFITKPNSKKVTKYLFKKITLFISTFVKDLDSNAQNIVTKPFPIHCLTIYILKLSYNLQFVIIKYYQT